MKARLPFLFLIGDLILGIFRTAYPLKTHSYPTSDMPITAGDAIVCESEAIFMEDGTASGFFYGDISFGKCYHAIKIHNDDRMVEITDNNGGIHSYPIKNFKVLKYNN